LTHIVQADGSAQSSIWGVAAALAAGLCYGSVPVLARMAYLNGVPAPETVAVRTFAVAVILMVVVAWRAESLTLPRQLWPALAMQCLATFFVSTCYLAAVQFIPVGLAVIVFFTFPVLIVLAAPVLEGQRLNGFRMLCCVLAFIGLVIAVAQDFDQLDARAVLGLALAGLAALGIVAQFHSGRELGSALSPIAIGGLVHAVILPFVVGVLLATKGDQIALLPGSGVATAGLLAALGVALFYLAGYVMQMTSVRLAPSSHVAPFFNIEPVISTGLAVVVLGEVMGVQQYAGGALILGAIVVMTVFAKRTG
jgi:drug/metabolite transporter (DMT)-like permease